MLNFIDMVIVGLEDGSGSELRVRPHKLKDPSLHHAKAG